MFIRTESLAILQNLLKHLGVLSVSVHSVSGPEMKGVCDAVEATAEVWGCSVLQTNNTLVCSPKITFSGLLKREGHSFLWICSAAAVSNHSMLKCYILVQKKPVIRSLS